MANREIDTLVATKVMGLEVIPNRLFKNDHGFYEDVLKYSANLSDAWQVVEKLLADGFTVSIDASRLGATAYVYTEDGKCVAESTSGETPESICMAALKAKGVEINV